MEEKKVILILEDSVKMNKHIYQLLKERPELSSYSIEVIDRIDIAREFFDENKNEISCIITDLNMNDEWLEEWIEETNGGMFSGWVWLQHCVYNEIPDMKTIICSGYIDFLETELEKSGKISELKRDNIHLVPKGAGEGMGFSKLFGELKKVLGI